MATILTVQDVAKSFGTRRVLAGISFAVDEGDRIGLIGLNGSGKSTLLRLVVARDPGALAAGTDSAPDAGRVTWRRGLSLAYVPQEPRFAPGATVTSALREGLRVHDAVLGRLDALGREIPALSGPALDEALAAQATLHDRIEQLGGWEPRHAMRELAAALELPPEERAIEILSIGERRRVALARALLEAPELLALDEPTNHLDARTAEWLEERLRGYAGSLLLVTHDRYFLDRVATRILELDRGRLYSYDGNYSRFLEKQAERLETEALRERRRAAFVRRELDWIRRGPQARGTKQKARIDRFDAAVAARPTAADRAAEPLELRLPTGGRLGKSVLELRGLTRVIGGRTLFRDLSLILKPGDRVGIVGPNGAGKTTLVRTVLGQTAADAGEVVLGANTRIAYLDQGRADLRDDRTVLEEVAGDSDHVFLEDGPVHVRTFLRMLMFDDGFADTPVGVLSGGERNRVQLARLLRGGGNLLVLDEPTNDLDLVTLGVLEEALAGFGGCALVVSHDRWFLDRVATGILAFEGDGRVTFHEGNYSEYLERRPPPVEPPRAVPPAPSKPSAPPAAGPRRPTFKEKQELAGIEARITEAESRVRDLEAVLGAPETYRSRGAEVPRLTGELAAARAEVDRLYARWQELEALTA